MTFYIKKSNFYILIEKLPIKKGDRVMDELNNEELQEQDSGEEEEFELSHTDKLAGIFTEPSATFEATAKFPPKTSDWLIPVFSLIIVVIISNFLIMSNPIIKQAIVEKQLSIVEKQFADAVESGSMSQQQADEQMDRVRDTIDQQMAAGQIFSVIGVLLGVFIVFFIVAGVYFLFSRFALKGDGTYASAMVPYGLSFYISIIAAIIQLILSLSMDKHFQDLSVATFIDMDTSTFIGMLLSKLDIFSIWAYSIIAIGLAKMFKSEDSGKYFAMVFGLWIGVSIIWYFVVKAVPFLGGFGM